MLKVKGCIVEKSAYKKVIAERVLIATKNYLYRQAKKVEQKRVGREEKEGY